MISKKPGKHVRNSELPNQRRKVRYEYLNSHGKMHGGSIYTIMDELAASIAESHSEAPSLTRFDVGGFKKQVDPDNSLVFYGYITKAWTSAMDIAVQAYKIIRDHAGNEKFELVAQRHLTFVALDKNGQPLAVPPIIPENNKERERMERAEQRRILQKQLEELFDPPIIPQN